MKGGVRAPRALAYSAGEGASEKGVSCLRARSGPQGV